MNRRILVLTLALALIAVSGTAGPEKVAFPASYKSHVLYAMSDRPDNKTVRDIYVNPEAARMAKAGQPLPSGTVITMEVYKARVNEKGELVKDANGRLIKGELSSINVMEKRTGWGAEYPAELRNGEWEYASFTPDAKPRAFNPKPCFECHKPLDNQDFVFTYSQLLAAPSK